jgi:Flp pilus assembly protein TadG
MKGFQRSKAGASALVEFALVAPLLLLLLFGIIQYGFIFAAYMTLRNASAVTARYAILSNPTRTIPQIQAMAKSAITPMLDANLLVGCDVGTPTVNGGPATSITLRYTLPLIVSFVVPGSSENQITLTATTIMK